MHLSVKLKDYIKKEYGSIAKYCKTFGLDSKAVHNMLEPRRNLSNVGVSKWLEYFGPLGLNMERFFKYGITEKGGKEEIIEETPGTVPCYKTGGSIEDFDLVESSTPFMVEVAGVEMIPRYQPGERIGCKYQDHIEPGDIGIFLVNGNIKICFYSIYEGRPALSIVGKAPQIVKPLDGIKLIGVPC